MTSEICGMVVREGGSGLEGDQVKQLDTTLTRVLELSPAVDDLVGELPAPLVWSQCREAGQKLAQCISTLLTTVRY